MDIGRGLYVCNVIVWPGFDLWYYISDAILSLYWDIWYYFISLISLLYLFSWILVVAPLGVFWCRLSTVKVVLEFISHFTFASSHCNRWYCTKWATGLPQLHIKACITTSVCMGNIQNIIQTYKWISKWEKSYRFIIFSLMHCPVWILNLYMQFLSLRCYFLCLNIIWTLTLLWKYPNLCTVSLLLYLMVLKTISPGCGVRAYLMLF